MRTSMKIRDVVEKILATSLVGSVKEDKVVSEEERNECYSVKSEDVSQLVSDCCKDEYGVLSNVLCVMRKLRMSFTCSLTVQVTMLLWCIWLNRNDKIWNDNVQMPNQIGRHVFDAWNEWYSVHKLQRNIVSMTIDLGVRRWEKPALGWVKCNVDVAFVTGSKKTSVGLCFCDNNGQFMAGMTQWQQNVISTVEGETCALLLAMKKAIHTGLDRVQFESDSNVLIDVIHMKRRGNSEFLSIVHDILLVLYRLF
ncbi:hypothetical protein TSUD_383330 [Trifolium subterraneum]|uniref:RNase H type-1 domain-containing protein n=1 Tax=Trifolium subterraneum TaxID=3900 RepID=A0A2Z6MB99_TRISU|nr:hypothetical protein TSUD_383330 [Trifolium subterraneum]